MGSGARKEEFMFGEVAGIGVEEELEEFGGVGMSRVFLGRSSGHQLEDITKRKY